MKVNREEVPAALLGMISELWGKRMEQTFEKTAMRVSAVSILGNTLLSLIKLLVGIFAHSGALISDAVHSASDVFSSFIVIIGVKLAAKASDEEHPYGHERMECVAAIVLAVVLLVTGLFIGHTAVEQLSAGNWETLQIPGALALAAAAVSIVFKEGMYWYTRFYALRLDSGALMADAWHHRSDALSSVGALVGIWGARMGFLWLDAVASLVICLFIAKAAFDIFRDATEKMVDHACSEEMQKQLSELALCQPGVTGIMSLKTREFGSRIYVDILITADGSITLSESAEIAERVHKTIEAEFPKVKHISVRIRPE